MFARELEHASVVIKLLTQQGKIPDCAEATAFLQQCSPDLGGSCWTDQSLVPQEIPLSVIIPTYNVESYVVNCIQSVLQQKVSFPFEVIVVNDGSTDATAQLVETFRGDARVTVIHQKNQGLSAARNTGIAVSKGQYLCFVDSDDELCEGALEAWLTTAISQQAKIVIGSYVKCLRNGTVQYTKALKDEKSSGSQLPGFAHGRIIHRSVFQNLRFPVGYWYEDTVMAQIIHPMCCDAIYTLSRVCYKYYANETGISTMAKGKQKSLDSLWIMMHLLKDRRMYGIEPTQRSYESFLSSVQLTYHRTKHLGPEVARSVFVLQRELLERYYHAYEVSVKHEKFRLQNALRANDYRKYLIACEFRH